LRGCHCLARPLWRPSQSRCDGRHRRVDCIRAGASAKKYQRVAF